ALDGRARLAQRGPSGRAAGRRVGRARAPRHLARLTAHGRAAGAGRPHGRLRLRPVARDADDVDLPAPPQLRHPRPPPGAARRRHQPHRAAQPSGRLRQAAGVAALADYGHVLDIPTRWKDNDVYGHVNNVEYYSYFDTVINRWLITEGGLDIHAGSVIGLC